MEKIAHNPDEVIALVDENDQIIGETTRGEAHKKGLLHRESCVYIISSKKQILLQKRKDNKLWDSSVAGHFPHNEDYLQGAIRELYEELGIKAKKSGIKEIAKERIGRNSLGVWNNRFLKVFLLKKDIPVDSFILDGEEIEMIKYFDLNEVKRLISGGKKTTTACKFLIEKYFLKLIS